MKNHKESAPGKREFILIAAVLLAALLLSLIYKVRHTKPAVYVEISVDGTVTETLDLSRDQEYTVTGVGGGTNRLVIKNGEVWVTEASCPDKICVHQGKISHDGEMIVCLPNRMVARISGES